MPDETYETYKTGRTGRTARTERTERAAEQADAPGATEPADAPRMLGGTTSETDAERRRRRARFLRDLAEARELRDRVQPRRVKTARLRQAMRMRTFRW
ncbi:hypothetical protein ABT373_11610 [Streptomyces sp. NPDC000070]|uniref:hypothetical protein n=1 Tax=Streptomyces sp. NPDC000070 TaxID=3154240 RepID=UPI0033298630